MSSRDRLIRLMQYLKEHSDDENPVSTAQIRRAMQESGNPMGLHVLREDIAALRAAGYDIAVHEQEGQSTTYAWKARDLDDEELQILVDAVSASQFITEKLSRELIDKLAAISGPTYKRGLKPTFHVSEHIKAPNENILKNVRKIRRDIEAGYKISFRYLQYTLPDKKQIVRYAGTDREVHVVSPYDTIWNNDRYYLVGYSDRDGEVRTYRIDRMTDICQVQIRPVPKPADYHVQDYVDKVFWMYDGNEEEVTLRCRNHLLDQVIDRFGEGVEVKNITAETFDIQVNVCVTGTFFAWVFQFGGEIVIAGPESVQDRYVHHMEHAIDATLAE